jgi:anti-anti-sigma factor
VPEEELLQVIITTTADALEVVAKGEVDLTNASEFETALRDGVLSANGRVRVDLSAVEYLGSEGIRALVKASRLAA